MELKFLKDEISFFLEYSAIATENMLMNKTSSFASKQNLSSSKTMDKLSLSKSLGLSSMAPEAWAKLVTRLDKGGQEWQDFYR